ncbi:hypothetical protein L4C33_19755, partial [Vibrio makurazakiensis]
KSGDRFFCGFGKNRRVNTAWHIAGAEFFQFMEVHYGMVSFQIIEITDDNYQELLVKGVFYAI